MVAIKKLRNICFTWNNYPVNWDSVFYQLWNIGKVRYYIGGYETAETGTLHIQGYVEFKNQVTLNWLKKNISPDIHWEERLGNQQQAIDYCKVPVSAVS